MDTEFMSNFSMGLIITKAFINILDAYITYLFCIVLFNKRGSLKTILLLCFSFPAINLLASLIMKKVSFVPDILVLLSGMIVAIFAQRVILKIFLIQSVMLFFITSFLLGFLGELFSNMVLKYINHYSLITAIVNFNLVNFVIASLLVNLFQIIVLFVIKLLKVKLPLLHKISKRKLALLITYIFLTWVILMFTYYVYYASSFSNGFDKKWSVIFTFVIIAFAVLNLTVCIIFIRFETKEQELEYQRFYNNAMDKIISDLRSKAHNFDNILACICGYIQLESWDKLKQYFHEIVGGRNKTNSINISKLLQIKNAGLLGVLISKLDKATEAGVEVNIEIIGEVSQTKMRIYHLCEIVGVLLDNAVEAAEISNKKRIVLVIKNTDGMICFKIENSVKEIPDMDKIFVKGWSTKGNDRGLGLFLVRNILNKNYGSALNTRIDGDSFIQELKVV